MNTIQIKSTNTAAKTSTVVGQITSANKQMTQTFVTDSQARQQIFNGLQLALQQLSSLVPSERETRTQELVNGYSLTGFVNTQEGTKVDSIDALRTLIVALNKQLVNMRVIDRGSKLLFSFMVPRGWNAYAGEIEADRLQDYYDKKDRKDKASYDAWCKRQVEASAAGKEFTEAAPKEYVLKRPFGDAINIVKGPWASLLCTGTLTNFSKAGVNTPNGLKYKGVTTAININVPHFRSPALSFVVDRQTGQLVTWQAGRYMGDIPAFQKSHMVVLTSGDTCDEFIY